MRFITAGETKMTIRETRGAAIIQSDELLITDAQSALDLMATVKYETGCDAMAIPKETVAEDFFILSTGLAGEILQKFVTYRVKLAIIGDYSRYTCKPLRDFMYESNNGSHFFFVGTEAEAVAKLTKEAERGSTSVCIREITPVDYPLLEDFLYHAIFVPPGTEAPPRDVIYNPDVFLYVDGFGSKPGDCGVVAEVSGKVVGAAWERIIPAFGHVDEKTPELAISVLPEYRGQAIGTLMMKRLFGLLRERGYKQTSLAVQKENAAVRFYQRLGYKTIRDSVEEHIMVKDLTDAGEITDTEMSLG
jgi:ribosomal protein S18 acetylase RimI-like enzyme